MNLHQRKQKLYADLILKESLTSIQMD